MSLINNEIFVLSYVLKKALSGGSMKTLLQKTRFWVAYLVLYAVAVVVILHASAPALAAQTGTVTINGQVPAVCDVIVTPEAAATNIADISAGDTNLVVATVNENCNNVDGYTMTVAGTNSSDHTGLFVDSVSGDHHPFTITYDNVAVPVSGVVTDMNAPGINLDKTVRITYASDGSLTPSTGFTYAETLTFTIAAK